MPKLLYKIEKKIRGSLLEIFTDGTVKITSKTSKYGMNIPAPLQQWKKTPKSREERILIIADFELLDKNNLKTAFQEIECEIYHNNYSGYIRPLNNSDDQKTVRMFMKENNILTCLIHGIRDKRTQLISTKKFNQAVKLRNQINFKQISEMKLITLGGLQETTFAIYTNKEKTVFIDASGIMDSKGFLVLSDELGRYITKWFENEVLCVCSINGNEPIVLSTVIRKRPSNDFKPTKEINIPYYGKRKMVRILFSNDRYQLTNQAKSDYRIKELLVKNNFHIKSFKSNSKPEIHYNEDVKKRFQKTVQQGLGYFKDITFFSEVEMILDESEQNIAGLEKNTFDRIALLKHNGQLYLILIEYKTSFIKDDRFKLLEFAIAKLFHFTRKINEQLSIPILIVNSNMKHQNGSSIKQIYNDFGVELIVLNDFLKMEKEPQLLHKLIERKLTEKKVNNGKKDFSKGLQFIGNMKSNHAGTKFENQVNKILKREGLQIRSNMLYYYRGRRIEIDHVASDNETKIMVSCKNRSTVSAYWRTVSYIVDSINVLELKKRIFGIKNTRLYVKVQPKYRQKLKELFEKYNNPVNTEIIIQ
ncbi:MAG: hypothetical protein JXA54_06250 [Candidatus Heimdallarchaeota archaeon]|nr:hypothetical protein [Candidatus Heimdallarchaeota archaeon]